VTIDLRARNLAGAGVYRLDWGVFQESSSSPLDSGHTYATITDFTTPVATTTAHQILLSADGEYRIDFGSLNGHAAHEATRSVHVKIDKTAPSTGANLSPSANGHGWNTTNVTVRLSASDLSGSGVNALTYALSGGQTGATT